jgi:hypothetical protein
MKRAKNAEGMAGLCHHFVVKSAFIDIFYNHNNPSGLKGQLLIRINT